LKTSILIVSDRNDYGRLLSYVLIQKKKSVLVSNFKKAVDAFKNNSFDLVIFHDRLDKSPANVALDLRHIDGDIPFLYISKKTLKYDISKGFSLKNIDTFIEKGDIYKILIGLGSEDFIKNSFRKPLLKKNYEFKIGDYNYNSRERFLVYKKMNKRRRLSFKENQLMRLLVININNTLSRDFALNKIWGKDDILSSRTMDVYISKLRGYLKEDQKLKIINFRRDGFSLSTLN